MKYLNNKNLLFFLRILCGLIFIFSAITKSIYTGSFVKLIEQYGFESISQAAPIVIIIEAILGIGLVFNIYTKFISIISFIVTLIFTVAYVYAFSFNNITDCGCFGPLKFNLSPAFNLIRNVLLMVALFFIFIKSSFEVHINYWKILISIIFISSISFVTGFTYFDEFTTEETENYSYEGKHLSSTPLKNYIPVGTHKRIVVFCFSYGCQYCINSVGNLMLFKNHVDTIYALAQADSLKKQLFLKYIKPNFVIIDIPYEVMKNIVPSYPTTFFIRNDTIVYQYSGFLSSPLLFKDNF